MFERVDISFSFNYSGRTIVTPKSVLVIIHSSTQSGPLFYYKRDLVVSADGSRLSLGKMLGGDKRRQLFLVLRKIKIRYFERSNAGYTF